MCVNFIYKTVVHTWITKMKLNLEFYLLFALFEKFWDAAVFSTLKNFSGVRTTVNISDSAELSAQELDKNTENLANAYMCSRLRSSCSLINQTSRSYGSLNPHVLVFVFVFEIGNDSYFWNYTNSRLYTGREIASFYW